MSAFLAAFKGVQAGINLNSAQNIAVYWGQNSINLVEASGGQKRLSYYCQNGPQVDTLILSFVTMFNGEGGYPETNFANAGDNCTTFAGTQLLNCPQIADDIVTCQSLGKTILLSTGGGTYNEGGFSTEAEAVAAANKMWEIFGPVSSNTSVLRPFGTAVIDGFDFDFENLAMNNMPAYANQLRSLYSTDKSKTYYMTAAPQCVYPDYADGPMLAGAVYFDAIFIQFYNNGCGINSYVPGATTQWNFNFNVWDNWAKTISLNPNVRVFIGVPGNTGAGSGYEPPSFIGEVINFVTSSGWTSFGGIMIWDASQVWANSGFLSGVYSYLPSGGTTTSHTTTTTSTTSKATTTTTSSTSTKTTLITTTTSKTSTTTTKSSTTTSTPPSATCPVSGGACPTNGAYACTGSSFGICNFGAWVIESCSAGQVCVQAGNGVYCAASGSSDPVC